MSSSASALAMHSEAHVATCASQHALITMTAFPRQGPHTWTSWACVLTAAGGRRRD